MKISLPGSRFFKDLKADMQAATKEVNQAAADGEAEKQARADYKDALGTKNYAECVKNLSLVLNLATPPTIKHLDGPVELKGAMPLKEDDDFAYWFIGDTDGKNVKLAMADFDDAYIDEEEPVDNAETGEETDNKVQADETGIIPEEMSLGEFLERTDGGKFDIIPVLYNLNYSAKNAFMPENIKKVLVPNPNRGDQIIVYTKDGKVALLDFMTGRRIVKETDDKISLIDDDGYTLNREDILYNYEHKK